MGELTYISLFSGAGGGDLGMDAAGYRCVAQVEIDPQCQKVLRRHWPQVPKWSDVCEVRGDMLPPADVIVFGSPCQDLSVANATRAGLSGERSGLFHQAVRIIDEQRTATDLRFPRAAIWENVPGALSSNSGEDFADALRALAGCGAHLIEWCVVDARHFVPQRRRRVFVAAVFDAAVAARCGDPLFPVGPRCSRHSQQSTASRATATTSTARGSADSVDVAGSLTAALGSGGPDAAHAAAGWMVAVDADTGGDDGDWILPDEYPTIDASFGKQQAMNLQSAAGGHLLHTYVKRGRAQSDSDPETWSPGNESPTLNSFDNGSDGRATVLAFTQNQREELRDLGDVAGALSAAHATLQTTYLATIPAKASATLVRRLTPLEVSRLQGWPDSHTALADDGTPIGDSHRYRMAGNGIASPALQWIAAHLATALKEPE